MTACVTQEKVEEYKRTFSMFDPKGQGYITSSDLKNALKKLGKSLTKKEVKMILKRVDTDGDGKIDLNEFIDMMSKASQNMKNDAEHIRDSFRVFDRDGNGFISKEELRHVMGTLGEELTEDEVADMIKEADMDGDGQINYDEFVKMMFGQK